MSSSFIRSSNDRSGSQINESIFAWGYSYKKRINYLGSFGDFNFDDHFKLSKMLNIPLPFKNKPSDWDNSFLLESDDYSSINPNYFIDDDFLKIIREKYWIDKERFKFKYPKVCVHIRRGDVKKGNIQGRYVPNSYYVDIVKNMRIISPNSRILIFSESESEEGFQEFSDIGCELKIDCDLKFCWEEMISCDVFVMSVGSFSYVPAMYNSGFVIFYPAWYTKLNHWNHKDDPDIFNKLKSYLEKKYNEL